MADLLKHPAEFFLRYLVIREGPQAATDAFLKHTLGEWGFLEPLEDRYFGFLRQRVGRPPEGFDPASRTHRASVQYLREQQVYDIFFSSGPMSEAWGTLADPFKRSVVEQVLTSRLDPKLAVPRLNKKYGWFLTPEGVELYAHYFWNVKLLSFDEWGRFLFNRTALYERHMALLEASPHLAMYHLRLEQQMESMKMIQRAQEIAFFTLEELAAKPGTRADKVKGIAMMTKAINECHAARSTSDMALKEVLKEFERFRMEYPLGQPPAIAQLAPGGNFSRSGLDEKKPELTIVHSE